MSLSASLSMKSSLSSPQNSPAGCTDLSSGSDRIVIYQTKVIEKGMNDLIRLTP